MFDNLKLILSVGEAHRLVAITEILQLGLMQGARRFFLIIRVVITWSGHVCRTVRRTTLGLRMLWGKLGYGCSTVFRRSDTYLVGLLLHLLHLGRISRLLVRLDRIDHSSLLTLTFFKLIVQFLDKEHLQRL